jgi:hypothetical protein
VKAWRLAARIAHAEHDPDDAEGHFQKSLGIANSIGNPVQLWKAEIALGQFLQEEKRVDEARQAFGRALALMQRVRDGIRDERLKGAIEKNPEFRLLQNLVTRV